MPAGIFVRNTSGNNPKITNSIVWHNRSYYFGLTSGGVQIPGHDGYLRPDRLHHASPCPSDGFRDTGRSGSNQRAHDERHDDECSGPAPAFVREYVNTDRRNSYQQDAGTTILAPAALDEGGNFIRPQFGPLSLTRLDDTRFSNYHTSVGVDGIALNSTTGSGGYGNAKRAAALGFDHRRRSAAVSATPRSRGRRGAGMGFVASAGCGQRHGVDARGHSSDHLGADQRHRRPAPPHRWSSPGSGQVVGGTATTNGGTTVTYTPDAGFNGHGSFAYAISGAGGGGSAHS